METLRSLSEKDLLDAYSMIFTDNKILSVDHLRTLDTGTLKNAYRERVFETHPDRAQQLGIEVALLEKEFKEITMSFEKLYYYVKNKHNLKVKKVQKVKPQKDNSFGKSNLMFGQYLYYSGIITFKSLLDAVYWQRNQRPPFGELANKWSLFTEEDTLYILKMRKPRERFGDCALRLGLISSFQHKAILIKQKNMQKPIGKYFTENDIFSEDELKAYLDRHELYNQMTKGSRFN